jgi:uncharacterized protein (DUF2252 family)
VNIKSATKSYENWMRTCAPIIETHLRNKHAKMKEDPFQFLRATYYRWAQLWPAVCSKFTEAPSVLSVGDLHVDSYGTWRDAEGRLCWGIDDFDESWPLPYTNDLIRLAASVKIAKRMDLLGLKTKLACEVILNAYERALMKGGCPIVLAEQERHLEKLGISTLKAPKCFWEKLGRLPRLRADLPPDAKKALGRNLPHPNPKYRVVQREAGLGSLGQQRFVAIADYRGGCIAREAKRVVPSANLWLIGRTARHQSYYEKTIRASVRSFDPYQTISGSWLVRRLSPDSNPIYIEELSKKRDEEILLHAMGTEAANVHLGTTRQVKLILTDLRRRKPNWLQSAAQKMAKITLREWKEYRR